MWNPKKSIRLSLILTYVFMALLLIGAVALPFLVQWYVEVRHREASLPTTIMLTCYPCVPFAVAILLSLRRLLHDLLQGKTFLPKHPSLLKRISWCCFAITAVMLFAGRFYLPFYVCAVCTAFMGLIVRIVKNIFCEAMPAPADETEELIIDNI